MKSVWECTSPGTPSTDPGEQLYRTRLLPQVMGVTDAGRWQPAVDDPPRVRPAEPGFLAAPAHSGWYQGASSAVVPAGK